MKTRAMGATGTPVSIIGQGTWELERHGKQDVIRALRRGLDLGMTHIDTAEMYGSGEVERIIGEAIAGRRGEVFLASKVLPYNASYAGTLRACEASLKRLRTEYLDLYLLHWAGSEPVEETVRAFERLVSDGKIRAYGVSNFDSREIEEVVSLAGQGKVACNQVLYHLHERGIEHEVIPTCEQHGIAVVGYSSLRRGHFPSRLSAGGRALKQIAGSHGATPQQVALSFLTRRPTLFAIPKAAKISHIEQNAAAAALALSGQEIQLLERAFPRGPKPRELPSL